MTELDLTQQELEELRRGCALYIESLKSGNPWGPEIVSSFHRMGGEHQVILRLIAMASRSVSEETLRAWLAYDNASCEVTLDARIRELLGLVSRDIAGAARALSQVLAAVDAGTEEK